MIGLERLLVILQHFFLKILNLAVRHILIKRRELIQFIGKSDQKTKHHNYKPLQLHLQLKRIRLGHRRCRTLVSWIGTSTRPHHCPGRIGTSTQTSTLPDWIGTSKSARSDLDVDTSLNRQTPLGWIGLGHRHELSYYGQRLQPSSTTNSTRSSQELPATPPWRHCRPTRLLPAKPP